MYLLKEISVIQANTFQDLPSFKIYKNVKGEETYFSFEVSKYLSSYLYFHFFFSPSFFDFITAEENVMIHLDTTIYNKCPAFNAFFTVLTIHRKGKMNLRIGLVIW